MKIKNDHLSHFATSHHLKDLGIGQQLMLMSEGIQIRKDVPLKKQKKTYTQPPPPPPPMGLL